MADNITTDPGAGGEDFVTREISHSGDTVQLSGVFVMGIAGTEGAYTAVAINGDATNGLDVDVTRVSGTVTVGGVAAENAAVSGNPVLSGGRFDSSARTLGDGDVGALALNASGHLIADVSASTGGTHVDDAAFTAGTDDGVPIFGFVTSDSVDSGDAGAVAMSTDRNLHTSAVGRVAHDAAAAGNPVLVGARATADVEALTEVAEADASYVATDLQGVAITREAIAAQEIVTYSVSNTAGTEITVTGLDAGGAGIHNYVTSVIIHNANASTNGFIQLLDGSAGTVLATFPNPAGGGTAISFPVPLKQTTANTALFWDGSAAITTVYITIVGYQGQG